MQKVFVKFKIWVIKGQMRNQNGTNKKTIMRLFFLLFLLLSIIFPAFGWMGERQENEKNEKEEKNQLLAVPIVYYTPETKIAGGVGAIYYLRSLKDQLRGHPSTVSMSIIYTQKKQFTFEISPGLYLKKGRVHLVGYAGFKNYVANFYGIGSQTTENMREDYSYRSIILKCSLRNRITPSLYAGLQCDLEHSKITELEPGGMLDTADIEGSQAGTISGLGVLFIQDNRDSIFFPTRGSLLQLQASRFYRTFGRDNKIKQYSIDYRQYMTVFSKHVLAFQQSVQMTSGNVPFQRLPILGGPNILRGFIQGRFRDKKAIFFQMEYRVPLIWRLSAVGFVGYGDVADKLSEFNLKNFKVTGGLGLRYQVNRTSGTNLRCDFGFAKGNFNVYFTIYEAF